MIVPMQVCRRCGQEKMLIEYRQCNWNAAGLDPTCRSCRKDKKKPTEIERLRKHRPENQGETWWKRG